MKGLRLSLNAPGLNRRSPGRARTLRERDTLTLEEEWEYQQSEEAREEREEKAREALAGKGLGEEED